MSENCPKCGSPILEAGNLFQGFRCGTYHSPSSDRLEQSKSCCNAQIAALTQRLEQAEARIKEYRDKVEGLEMDKDKYRDKWLNTLERATAAEDREKRLRDAVRKIKANSYLDDNVLNRHSFTTTGCEALREAFALIAQPSDQKEAEGASL